ncbi:pantothenate kinase, putative [Plasmodium ovale]|uniref:Pantothenate kinase, putative n=1 Tax=Plasmodium ovale TaxID=36330 RepID=A0A1C3KXC4_PLAOA|nr:pantothenate kinase, putative [Plasmodium ovale]
MKGSRQNGSDHAESIFKNKQNVYISGEEVSTWSEGRRYLYEYVDIYKHKDNGEDQKDIYKSCALDIGGTLIKVAYMNDKYIPNKNKNNKYLKIKMEENIYLYVTFFNITELEEALKFLLKNRLIKRNVMLTGGGSHKYYYEIIHKIVQEEVYRNINIPMETYTLFVSKYGYCKESLTLCVHVYLSTRNDDHNKVHFNQEFLGSFANYEHVQVYLLKNKVKEENFENSTVDFTTQVRCNLEKKNVNSEENTIGHKNTQWVNIASDISNTEELLLKFFRKDEMHCVVNGMYMLFNVRKSVVRYDTLLCTEVPVQMKPPHLPFILANIGSGISILKSDGCKNFSRISGTAVGGGTLMGLAQTILGKISFDELIKLASKGTSSLDLHIKHIREDAAGGRCIHGHALATSFGAIENILKKQKNSQRDMINQDVARSLVTMVSHNIGYLVYLLSRIHNVTRIFFSGKYVSNNEYVMESLTHGVYYYPLHLEKNSVESSNPPIPYSEPPDTVEVRTDTLPEVLFLKHDGFLGAIGCFFA